MTDFAETPPVDHEGDVKGEQLRGIESLLTSKFGLLPESIVLDPQIISGSNLQGVEQQEDADFRKEIYTVLPEVTNGNGRTLVLLSLATQHAVATLPAFLQNGFDSYLTFFPPPSGNDSYYHQADVAKRVAEVALRNQIAIRAGKDALSQENLRGYMINIHSHALKEDAQGVFAHFHPTEEQLRHLGVSNIALIAEAHPNNAAVIHDWIQEASTSDQLYKYIRDLGVLGFPIKVVGIDKRVSEKKLETPQVYNTFLESSIYQLETSTTSWQDEQLRQFIEKHAAEFQITPIKKNNKEKLPTISIPPNIDKR